MLKTDPSPHKRRIAHVPQAPPIRLAIPSLGIHADVGQLAITTVDGQAGLNPPEATLAQLMNAYWWNQRQAPGNPTEGTTYIIGHTCHSAGCPAVFNPLQGIHLGAQAVVETTKGVMTYRSYRKTTVPRTEVAGNPEINRDHKESLVLMACKLRADGGVQTDNFIVWFKLVSAVRK